VLSGHQPKAALTSAAHIPNTSLQRRQIENGSPRLLSLIRNTVPGSSPAAASFHKPTRSFGTPAVVALAGIPEAWD